MTARLTRWLNIADNFETKMAQLLSVRRYGRLTRATGLVLKPPACSCFFCGHLRDRAPDGQGNARSGKRSGGFNGQRLFLMPLEEVEGHPARRARLCEKHHRRWSQSGKQPCLYSFCWGCVCWFGSGKTARRFARPGQNSPKPAR